MPRRHPYSCCHLEEIASCIDSSGGYPPACCRSRFRQGGPANRSDVPQQPHLSKQQRTAAGRSAIRRPMSESAFASVLPAGLRRCHLPPNQREACWLACVGGYQRGGSRSDQRARGRVGRAWGEALPAAFVPLSRRGGVRATRTPGRVLRPEATSDGAGAATRPQHAHDVHRATPRHIRPLRGGLLPPQECEKQLTSGC